WLKPQNVQFWEFKQEDVVRLFTQLILVALIIERALEVIPTPWRGPEAERMTAELQHHDQLAKSGNPTAQDNLQKSKLDLTDFKCKTQNLAFKVSFVLGIIVASFGIRTLAPLVEPNAFGKLPHLQQVGFAALDVFLTGALLSGGADALHQRSIEWDAAKVLVNALIIDWSVQLPGGYAKAITDFCSSRLLN